MSMLNMNHINDVNVAEDDDSSNDVNVNNSVMAQDQVVVSRVPNSTLGQALTTYIPNTSSNTVQQQRIEDNSGNLSLLNASSRVTIAVGKYPSDATLHNYDDFQLWMYTHANKCAPVDICQSLDRLFLLRKDHYDNHTLFNLHLVCAEAYQTIGHVNQAYCQFQQAETVAKMLDNTRTIMSLYEISERERKRKKLEEIGMKLEFQSEFHCNLIKGRTHQKSNSTHDNFLKQLNADNPSPEQCRCIWRQIVLQFILNPSIAIPGAQWLLSYAYRHQSNTLSHANSLYVALNLLLFGYGSTIFKNHLDIDVFKILDDIGRYFEENGNQSKQFSPVHKMAHVWGTAAVAFYLASDEQKYLVCASMIRVSFESLGICFLSSGIESLYILANKHAPDFFTMMAHDPNIKLISPYCINYFRRKLEDNVTCIRYSTETVNQFVFEVFNVDVTDHRI